MFKSMKLATKLTTAFVAVCAIGAVVSAIGIRNMATMSTSSETMYKMQMLGLSFIKEANMSARVFVGRCSPTNDAKGPCSVGRPDFALGTPSFRLTGVGQ